MKLPKWPGLPRIRLPTETAVESFIRGACLVAGLFALARGLWLIHPPTAWIVVGLMLIWCGAPAREERRK